MGLHQAMGDEMQSEIGIGSRSWSGIELDFNVDRLFGYSTNWVSSKESGPVGRGCDGVKAYLEKPAIKYIAICSDGCNSTSVAFTHGANAIKRLWNHDFPYYFDGPPSNLPSMKPVPTLADLLATLPDEERFILTLHYLKGISAEEIAEKLGVPHKSVLAVVEMGKKRLLAALDFPPFP